MKRRSIVSLVNTENRTSGIQKAIGLLRPGPFLGKPNFITADPCPGSTHNDTLSSLIKELGKMGAKIITVGDRSGPAETSDVIGEKGVDRLCQDLGAKLMNFEDLAQDQWERIKPEGATDAPALTLPGPCSMPELS